MRVPPVKSMLTSPAPLLNAWMALPGERIVPPETSTVTVLASPVLFRTAMAFSVSLRTVPPVLVTETAPPPFLTTEMGRSAVMSPPLVIVTSPV